MENHHERLPVYIAAGGKSSRFGSDKARAPIYGEPLVQRLARLLEPWTLCLRVVAAPGNSFGDLNLETVADIHPGIGPMAALHTALLHAPDPSWILLVSCDFVLLERAWIDTLLAGRSPDVQAVAFAHCDGAVEPLLALYQTSLRPDVDDCIRTGRLSLSRLLLDLAGEGQARVLALPVDWTPVSHVNTVAEMKAAVAFMSAAPVPEGLLTPPAAS